MHIRGEQYESLESKMNKIAKNAAWIITANIAQCLLSFVIGMLTARYLGPSNYGLITYAASLAEFAMPIAQLGISNVLVRELVDYPEEEGKILGTSIFLNAGMSCVCLISITVFATVTNLNEPVTIVVCALYSIKLVFHASELLRYWYQARLLSKYSSLISLFTYVIVSGYKVFLLATQQNIYWFALTAALESFLIGSAGFIIYKRLGGMKLTFSKSTRKRLLEKGRYYIIPSMMVTIFSQTDKIMLKLMLDETSTGYYGAATTCAGITGFVFLAIIDSFRPSIFEAKKTDEKQFERLIAMLYCIITYLSLAQSIVITIFAPIIVHIIYGPAYAPAQNVLQIVAWYSIFSYYGIVRNIWILAKDKQKHLWKINLSGAIANVLLNAVLIPAMGINGAAVASLVTQFFTNIVTGYLLKQIRDHNRIILMGLKPGYLIETMRMLIVRKQL